MLVVLIARAERGDGHSRVRLVRAAAAVDLDGLAVLEAALVAHDPQMDRRGRDGEEAQEPGEASHDATVWHSAVGPAITLPAGTEPRAVLERHSGWSADTIDAR